MIRALRPSDVPRQLLPGRLASKDMASTRETLRSPARSLSPWEFASWAALAFHRRMSLGAFNDGALRAVVFLQAKRALTAWEIARLFSSAQGYAELDDLVTACVRAARRRGADRLFLRSPSTGGACGPAERAGFRKAFTEEVFAGELRSSRATAPQLRRMRASDLHAVFRLHTAAAPPAARVAVGVTFEQWAAARDPAEGKADEFVWDGDRGLTGWLCLDRSRGAAIVEAALHPDCASRAEEFIASAAGIVERETCARWVAPGYEPALARALVSSGWRPDGQYEVYVRQVAQRVEEMSLSPVRA